MKKVLSWVLVLALVLSSFTMAFAGDTANSSDMKDAAAIQNVEAVDVMVATGIIGGYPDGYYYPEKAVTRAEMAKMISVAVNGGEDVGAYYANSCTFADSVNHWAAGYIAYCANEGIIDGRDANTFDPDANVTGVEAAKMMLVALGYDSKIEGFTGGQWAGNVLKAAKAEELFDGCDDFNAGAVLDRDNAAQIIFNGLMAKGVKYDHQYEITTGDTSVTVNTKAEALTSKLYERAFGTDLKPGTANADDFGRPAHSWVYDGDKVGTYADTADHTFVVTENATAFAAGKDYNEDIAFKSGNKAIINGDIGGATTAGSTDVKIGDVVELYENANGQVETTVILRYALVEITSVDTDVKASDAKKDVTCYIDITGTSKIKDTEFEGFDANTYVEDAYVAVIVKDSKVIASYIPEKVTGEVTAVKADDYVKVDGNKYTQIGVGFNDVGSCVAMKNTIDLYVDVNGYALGAVLVDEPVDDSYALITDLAFNAKDSAKGSDSVVVTVMGADGTEVPYTVADYDAVDAPAMKDLVDESLVSGTYAVPTGIAATAFDGVDAYLAKYTLDSKDKIVDFEFASASISPAKEVTAKGIVDGRMVSENVAAYEYDSTDKVWTVYGYADLLEAQITGAYMMKDGEIVAILLGSIDDGSTNAVIGFYADGASSAYKDADCAATESKYEVSLFVNGSTVDYDTVNLTAGKADFGNELVYALSKVTLNSEGIIKQIAVPVFSYGLAPLDTIADDVLLYGANIDAKAFNKVFAKSGNNVDLTSVYGNNYFYVGDAKVYKLSLDGDKLVMSNSSVKSIAANGYVMIMQLDEDNNAWDTIVYVSAADAADATFQALLDVTTATYDDLY